MFPLHSSTMLALEANHVIRLRLLKLALGGKAAGEEVQLMVAEKIDALFEATGTLLNGNDLSTVVERYREHVAANANRLAAG